MENGHSELPCSRISRHVGPHVIQNKCEYTDSTGCLRLELPSLWTIHYDRIPGLLNTMLFTVTLPSYQKNVRVLSRRLSRAPSKRKAVIDNNDSANGKQITKITINESQMQRNVSDCNVQSPKYSIIVQYRMQTRIDSINLSLK